MNFVLCLDFVFYIIVIVIRGGEDVALFITF